MKKISLFFILLFSSSLLFAVTTSSASLTLSGYKNSLTVDSMFIIDVKFMDTESVLINTTGDYDLTNTIQSNVEIKKAFTVTIYSNLKEYANANVQMTFTPFINQNDTSKTVPVKYTFTKDSFSPVEGDSDIYAHKGDEFVHVYMRYTPGLTFKNASGNSITSLTVNNTTTATLSQTIDMVEYKLYGSNDDWTDNNGGIPVWRDANDVPIATNVLPGFATRMLSTKAYFGLTVTNVNSFEADTKYIANVTLTVVAP